MILHFRVAIENTLMCVQDLSVIIDEVTFKRACRQGRGGQNMRFLRAICLQPYLALVQGSTHAHLQYDPSKSDVCVSKPFAAKLVQAIVQFAVHHCLPAGCLQEPNPSSANAPPTLGPATPCKRKNDIKVTKAASTGPNPDWQYANGARKSTRAPAPVDVFVPTMEGQTRKPKIAKPASDPQFVEAAVAEFRPKARKLLTQMEGLQKFEDLEDAIKDFREKLRALRQAALGT